MNYWFLSLLLLQFLGLGLVLAKHGEPKEDRYNFWSTLFATIIQTFLIVMAIKSGF